MTQPTTQSVNQPRDHDLELLQDASQRLVRTVDGLADDEWHVATGLPGWTRAHVVAHLALNAEGLGGALEGVYGGDGPAPMYASPQARDDDIEELAQAEPTELRARLLAGVTRFADAVVGMPRDQWGGRVERTPGGRTFRAASAIGMRWREVEIHHADLGAGYSRADWPDEFCRVLLDGMAKRDGWASPFVARADDLGEEWHLGDGSGPTVRGTAADLGWWLTGRGTGEGLTSDGGELPRIEEW